MSLTTPRWWYVRQGGPGQVRRTLLKPISWIWAWATAQRVARGPGDDPGVPVISVGNLTMGGSGKTPVVREALRILREAGIDAHGLSRGYVVLDVTRDRLQADWWLMDTVKQRAPGQRFAKGLVCQAGSRHLADAGAPMPELTGSDPAPAARD